MGLGGGGKAFALDAGSDGLHDRSTELYSSYVRMCVALYNLHLTLSCVLACCATLIAGSVFTALIRVPMER